ncbi:hypothetical protein E2320_018733 [Naja naja]|nr:hypothetical protein E2320_018733 [Naja naja]
MAAPTEESNIAEDFKKPILPPPLPPSLARGKAAEREAPKRPHGPEVGPCPLVLPEYEEPPWGGCPSEEESSGYSLETVKGGAVLDRVSFAGRSRLLVGRAPGCDLSLAHPCVSRHHAVLQRRPPRSSAEGEEEPLASETPEPGLYVYDLDSAHGTFLNKTRVPPRTYCRVRVGHVLRFGGSSRLFILQLKELRKQQQAKLEKTMLGDDSDEEQKEIEIKKSENSRNDLSCSWGMGEDAEEEEGEENPIAIEFQEDQEAFYLKDPKKALQGFFDREGEELEYEFDSHGTGTWLCRVKLPIDDASGKQLVAEAIHSGKKKEAMIQCSLEACRILDARGVLRQEAGIIEQKRLNRMKKAGKIDEKPETYDSLVAKLHAAERELSEIAEKLKSSRTTQSHSATQDSLDEFMTEIKSGCSVDSVTRKKLHLRTFELRKEQQRLKGLIKIVTPASMPELKSQLQNQDLESQNKPKKLTLPLFGAMKGGSKFRLKTGTVGKLPVKRPDIPVNLLNMKDEGPEEEEEEEEEEEDDVNSSVKESSQNTKMEMVKEGNFLSSSYSARRQRLKSQSESSSKHISPLAHNSPVNELQINLEASEMPAEKPKNHKVSSKPKIQHSSSSNYPEDDPDYCVWVPPEGQSGDGRTHLNAKYGY